MKAALLALGVLGLAAIFGMSEPAPVSAKPVTLDNVRLVSEQMAPQPSQAMSRHKTSRQQRIRF